MSTHKERVIENDPEAKRLWELCEKHNIPVENRCEDGVPHHPEAERIFELLKKADWIFGDDYFCWKYGGDGDNGETLMYSLSVLLEVMEAEGESI